MNTPIDIVIPWVDGNDPHWQQIRNHCQKERKILINANSNIRYQSWDNLHLLFRGIEKNMPWVRYVFLVTFGHIPAFLNIEHPKLKIVRHDSYIPDKYLPTFNSNVIELNYHRIKGLSENFILFNDDIFPVSYVDESYYFQNDIVCEEAVESPIMPVDVGHITEYSCMVKVNNLLFVNRHFSKREVQAKNPDKWFNAVYGDLLKRTEGLAYWNNFVGFHDRHMPVAIKKSTLEKIWSIEPDLLDRVSHNQFRDFSDISQCIIRYWQICEGDFVPRKTLGEPYFVTVDNYLEVRDDVLNRPHQMVCFTEDCGASDFEVIKSVINAALENLLPEKCSFER